MNKLPLKRRDILKLTGGGVVASGVLDWATAEGVYTSEDNGIFLISYPSDREVAQGEKTTFNFSVEQIGEAPDADDEPVTAVGGSVSFRYNGWACDESGTEWECTSWDEYAIDTVSTDDGITWSSGSDSPTGTGSWNWSTPDDLQQGAIRNFSVTIKIDEDATIGTHDISLFETVYPTGPLIQPDLTPDKELFVSVAVQGPTLELTAEGDETTPGGEATVSLELSNTGAATADTVGISLMGAAFDWNIATTQADGGTWFEEDRYWEVDNLAAGASKSPTITFEIPDTVSPGEYVVDAEVYLPSSESTTEATATVTVEENTPPNASFTVLPENPTVGETLTFDASESNDPDGTIETYEWKVGNDDEFTSRGQVFNQEITESGQTTIALRITDDVGASDEVTTDIQIQEDVPQITSEDITIEFENKFKTESTDSFLHSMFNEVHQAMPIDSATVPDKNSAYIHLDVTISFPEQASDSIEAIRPVFTHDEIGEGLYIEDFYAQGFELPPNNWKAYEVEPGVIEVENFRIAAPAQVTVTFIESILFLISSLGAGEITSPVEAKTEAYPDVYLSGLEVETSQGTEMLDFDKRLPRYDDVCMSVGLSTVLNPDCPVDDDLEDLDSGTLVLSPATVAFQDNQGRITGRIWEDGEYNIYNEIPNSVYSGPIRHEFVLASGNGYDVIIDGQEEGTATIKVDSIDDGNIKSHIYESISVDESMRFTQTMGDEDLQIDNSRDGEIDETIMPDIVNNNSPSERVNNIGEFRNNIGNSEDDSSTGSSATDTDETEDGDETSGDGGSDDGGGDGFGPGFGIGGALAGLGGAGYLLKRRLETDQDSEE